MKKTFFRVIGCLLICLLVFTGSPVALAQTGAVKTVSISMENPLYEGEQVADISITKNAVALLSDGVDSGEEPVYTADDAEVAAEQPKGPFTGDTENMAQWFAIMVASGIALLGLLLGRKTNIPIGLNRF